MKSSHYHVGPLMPPAGGGCLPRVCCGRAVARPAAKATPLSQKSYQSSGVKALRVGIFAVILFKCQVMSETENYILNAFYRGSTYYIRMNPGKVGLC